LPIVVAKTATDYSRRERRL